MKRVLCIISCMNTGGAETFLMKIYRNIDTSKYQMDFCINDFSEGYYEKEIISLGGKIYKIVSKSDNPKEFKKKLSKIIRENGYKYVLRITSNGMGFWDLKIAKKAGAKICSARSSNSSDGGGMKEIIAHKLGRILFQRYVDIEIAPSDLAAKYTFGEKDYNNGKVFILHNAVDLDVFHFSEKDREQIRHELGISDNQHVIGAVGRFETQKNHLFMIDIFKEYLKLDEKAVLVLVGAGSLEKQIKEKISEYEIEDSVLFTGVRKDVARFMSAMDYFLQPSYYEGMPNTVIEAQATGLRCLITDTITKEANITGLVKYLSLNESPEIWARAIQKDIQKGRINTRENFIKNRYDIQSVVEDFCNNIFD